MQLSKRSVRLAAGSIRPCFGFRCRQEPRRLNRYSALVTTDKLQEVRLEWLRRITLLPHSFSTIRELDSFLTSSQEVTLGPWRPKNFHLRVPCWISVSCSWIYIFCIQSPAFFFYHFPSAVIQQCKFQFSVIWQICILLMLCF